MSCNGGWIIGAMFAIDSRRKWMETVEYLQRNRDKERRRHKTTIRPLAYMPNGALQANKVLVDIGFI